MKFKVGDKVKFKSNEFNGVGEISHILGNSIPYRVFSEDIITDTYDGGFSSNYYWFGEEELELLPEEAKVTITSGMENGEYYYNNSKELQAHELGYRQEYVCKDNETIEEIKDLHDREMVNSPKHYNQGSIECIDAMIEAFGEEEVKIFCKINAFKYVWRANSKNGIEDIKKTQWYINKYLEMSEVENDK